MGIRWRRWAYGLLLAATVLTQATAAGFHFRTLRWVVLVLELAILGLWAIDEQRRRS